MQPLTESSNQCPSCGAALLLHPTRHPLLNCPYCRAAIVLIQGSLVPAVAYHQRNQQRQSVFAVVCRLCGAPFEKLYEPSQLQPVEQIVCKYCRHHNDVPPTIFALLRLVIFNPRMVMQMHRTALRTWGAFLLTLIVFCIAIVVTGAKFTHRAYQVEIPGSAPDFVVSGFMGWTPHIEVHANLASPSVLCFQTKITDVTTHRDHTSWIVLSNGVARSEALDPSNQAFTYSSIAPFRTIVADRGRYQLAFSDVRYRGPSPRPPIQLGYSVSEGVSFGAPLLLVNALLILLIIDLTSLRDQLTTPRRAKLIRGAMAAIFLVTIGYVYAPFWWPRSSSSLKLQSDTVVPYICRSIVRE